MEAMTLRWKRDFECRQMSLHPGPITCSFKSRVSTNNLLWHSWKVLIYYLIWMFRIMVNEKIWDHQTRHKFVFILQRTLTSNQFQRHWPQLYLRFYHRQRALLCQHPHELDLQRSKNLWEQLQCVLLTLSKKMLSEHYNKSRSLRQHCYKPIICNVPKADLNMFASGFSYPTSEDMITASNLQRESRAMLRFLIHSQKKKTNTHVTWIWQFSNKQKNKEWCPVAHRCKTLRSSSSFLKRESKLDTTASLTACHCWQC